MEIGGVTVTVERGEPATSVAWRRGWQHGLSSALAWVQKEMQARLDRAQALVGEARERAKAGEPFAPATVPLTMTFDDARSALEHFYREAEASLAPVAGARPASPAPPPPSRWEESPSS